MRSACKALLLKERPHLDGSQELQNQTASLETKVSRAARRVGTEAPSLRKEDYDANAVAELANGYYGKAIVWAKRKSA